LPRYSEISKVIVSIGKPLQWGRTYTMGEGHSGRRKPQGRQQETTLANTWYVTLWVCSRTILPSQALTWSITPIAMKCF